MRGRELPVYFRFSLQVTDLKLEVVRPQCKAIFVTLVQSIFFASSAAAVPIKLEVTQRGQASATLELDSGLFYSLGPGPCLGLGA